MEGGCLHLHTSQANNRAHFPPFVPKDQPPGSEGRTVVVKTPAGGGGLSCSMPGDAALSSQELELSYGHPERLVQYMVTTFERKHLN